MSWQFGSQPPRALKTFGTAGVLLENCQIVFDHLYSTHGLGRVSDLISSQTKKTGVDEFKLRALLLFSVFEACQAQAKDQPILVECGSDSEKLAVGISFVFAQDTPLMGPELISSVLSQTPKTQFDILLKHLHQNSDRLVLRYQSKTRRFEMVAMLALDPNLNIESSDRVSPEWVVIGEDEAPPVINGQTAYTALADLDYHALLQEAKPIHAELAIAKEKARAVENEARFAREQEVLEEEVRLAQEKAKTLEESRFGQDPLSQLTETRLGKDAAKKLEETRFSNDANSDISEKRFSKDAEQKIDSIRIATGAAGKPDELRVIQGGGAAKDLPNGVSGPSEQQIEAYERRIAELEAKLSQRLPVVAPAVEAKKGIFGRLRNSLFGAKAENVDPNQATEALLSPGGSSSGGSATSVSSSGASVADSLNGNKSAADSKKSAPGTAGANAAVAATEASSTSTLQVTEEEEIRTTPIEKLPSPIPETLSGPQAVELVEKIEKNSLNVSIERLTEESKTIIKEIENPRAKKWIENAMAELLAEKGRFAQMAMTIKEQVRAKEDEFRQREVMFRKQEDAFRAELQNREKAIRHKDITVNKMKESLAQSNANLEKLKGQMGAAAGAAAAGANANRAKGPTAGEMSAVNLKLERATRQLDEMKKQNAQLTEKVANFQTNQTGVAAASGDLKKRLDAATKMGALNKKQADHLSAQVEQMKKDEAKLKMDLNRVTGELNMLKQGQAKAASRAASAAAAAKPAAAKPATAKPAGSGSKPQGGAAA